MKLKTEPLIIDVADPFVSDALNRKESVEALTNFISNLNGPFVIAIDSPWGTGKTTFVKMWQSYLANKKIASLYFNSWQSDFSTDPLVAFVAEISDLMEETQKGNGSYKPHLNKARKFATALAKRALPTALRLGTAGLINLDDLSEEVIGDAAATNISDAIDLYSAEKNLMEQFHEKLSATIKTLEETGHHSTLIVFIDELDRCRPTYAIDLLERIKHLFNIENVIFVIAIDKEQLSVSLKGVYGEGLNTNEYLRRFIDLEFTLPKANSESFTKHLITKFSLKENFDQRQGNLKYDLGNFIATFNSLSSIFDLSLRAREQCFTKVAIALNSTPSNHYLYPELLATLPILSVVDKPTYKEFVLGSGTPANVISLIKSRPEGKAFLSSREGMFAEGFLIVSKSDRYSNGQNEIEAFKSEPVTSPTYARAQEMIEIIQHIYHMYHRGINLGYLSNKIELAAQLVN